MISIEQYERERAERLARLRRGGSMAVPMAFADLAADVRKRDEWQRLKSEGMSVHVEEVLAGEMLAGLDKSEETLRVLRRAAEMLERGLAETRVQLQRDLGRAAEDAKKKAAARRPCRVRKVREP